MILTNILLTIIAIILFIDLSIKYATIFKKKIRKVEQKMRKKKDCFEIRKKGAGDRVIEELKK